MSGFSITLYGFEILAGLSAIGILFTKNVFHAALLLMVCLLALAGVFVLYHAEFIAVAQILIYAGGILVLILFGIMLTSRMGGGKLVVKNQYIIPASFIFLSLSILLIKFLSEQNFYQQPPVPGTSSYNSINQTGILLMSNYVFPFETAGVVLLVALIGAAVTASSFNSKKQ